MEDDLLGEGLADEGEDFAGAFDALVAADCCFFLRSASLRLIESSRCFFCSFARFSARFLASFSAFSRRFCSSLAASFSSFSLSFRSFSLCFSNLSASFFSASRRFLRSFSSSFESSRSTFLRLVTGFCEAAEGCSCCCGLFCLARLLFLLFGALPFIIILARPKPLLKRLISTLSLMPATLPFSVNCQSTHFAPSLSTGLAVE